MFKGYTSRLRLFLLAPLVLVFVFVFAACGGNDDDDDVGSIEDAESCEDIGSVFIAEMQTLLDALSDMDMADFTSDEEPEAMTNFQASVGEIGAKGDELGCSDEEAVEILSERLDDLEADGPVAELVLQSFREGIESGEIFGGGS